MAIDWKKWILAALKEAPKVIKTVEVIHTNKDTASKTDLAATALVSAVGVADDLAPEHEGEIQDAGTAAAEIIAAFQRPPITAKTVTK